MVNISHLVRKLLEKQHFVLEGLARDIISVGNLAEELQPEIKAELGKKVNLPAITMAIRRYAEELKKRQIKKPGFLKGSEIIIRTNLIDISVLKSPQIFKKLEKLYSLVDFEKGKTLNIVQGYSEVAIVTSENYEGDIKRILEPEKIISVERSLVGLTINLPKEYFYTPGGIFFTIRDLAWNNINIFELVTTNTELTLIIKKNELTRAYNVLSKLISR